MLTLSVVSHRQAGMVGDLLQDIAAHATTSVSVMVTINVPERVNITAGRWPFPVQIMHNSSPKGFGANHNAAFRHCRTPFFCILNPDVRMEEDAFAPLLRRLDRDPRIGL